MAEQAAATRTPPITLAADLSDLRFILLIAALTAYGIGSSPTPDSIGGAEIFAGLFLILAAGVWKAAGIFRQRARDSWEYAARLLFFYGLTVPLAAGYAAGHDGEQVVRDMIAFLFLLLPLFMGNLCLHKEGYRRPLTAATALVGLLFSIRVLAPVFREETGPIWYIQPPTDPFYLANAPTVLFAALLLAGLAGEMMYRRGNIKSLPLAAIYGIAAFFPLAAMALITQRASMGIIILSGLFLMMAALWRSPRRAAIPLLVFFLVAWAGWDAFSFIGSEAIRKTAAVGLNMRWAEAMAVLNELSAAGPLAVVFGKGWGAAVASPAVGGIMVNFTHSLITTFWLKTGLTGLLLVLIYVFHMAGILLRLLPVRPVIVLALAGPLVIDIFLYASFKSLDFRLILLLVPVWAAAAPKVATADRSL